MAYIRYRPEQDLKPGERVPDPDNIIQIHAVHPAVMRQHYDLYREVMHGPGPLTRREREMIGVRASAINECRYWIRHHGAGLRKLVEKDGWTETEFGKLLEALVSRRQLPEKTTERERVLVDYADKLTAAPATVREADIDRLRETGLDDRAIHDACAVVSYFAFVNRIADGLGVELEEGK